MQYLAIPAPLAQAIADYLAQQPHRDVAGLLAQMAALKPVSVSPTPDKEA